MLHLRYSAGFWICFWFQNIPELGIYCGSKYIRVTQCFEYKISWEMFDSVMNMPWILNMAGGLNMLGLRSIIHVWQSFEYSSGSIPRVLDMLGFEYTRVVNMPKLHMVLCKLYFKDSRYLECFEFWICYVKVLNLSGV